VGGVVVVVICWFHSCIHARSMLLPAVQSLDWTHQGPTGQDSGHNLQTRKRTKHTHKIFSQGLLFFVDQDFYRSLVEAEKSASFS
jgi:hypothetical protein